MLYNVTFFDHKMKYLAIYKKRNNKKKQKKNQQQYYKVRTSE